MLAIWDNYTVIRFRQYNKETSKKISLISKLFESSHVIYFDSTNEYNDYFIDGIRIKPDRKPIRNENYKNLKHQLYFALIGSINDNELKINCEFPKDELQQEIDQLKLNNNQDSNKLEMTSRKQIVESLGKDIDLVDLLSYRFFAKLKGIE